MPKVTHHPTGKKLVDLGWAQHPHGAYLQILCWCYMRWSLNFLLASWWSVRCREGPPALNRTLLSNKPRNVVGWKFADFWGISLMPCHENTAVQRTRSGQAPLTTPEIYVVWPNHTGPPPCHCWDRSLSFHFHFSVLLLLLLLFSFQSE